jgi:predicted nuclease of predicted toxin-antitoxin system
VPGRFHLLTDENVPGPLIEGLKRSGWDVVLTNDVYGERSVDDWVFTYAAEHDRVLVSTDEDHLIIGRRWLDQGRSFRLVFWQQGRHQHVRVADLLGGFEALAAKENAFASCIEYLKV